jgi:hypothetical protein
MLKKFFEPSWKKLKWFTIVFFIAQLYYYIIMPVIPTLILQEFINFVLNPAIILFSQTTEQELIKPITLTLNMLWNYFLGTMLAREIDKEK